MLSILTNWKSYLIGAFLLSLLANYLQYNINLKNHARISLANQMRAETEQKLRVREKEAAQERVETQKLTEQLNKAEIPDECNQAIQKGISLIHPLKFQWDNNIL